MIDIYLYIVLALVSIIAFIVSNKRNLHKFDLQSNNVYRGVLILLIILGHIKMRVHSTIWDEVGSIGVFSVAVFFFMSGYGLLTSYLKKGKSYLQGFYCNRFAQILPQFVISMFLYFGILLLAQRTSIFAAYQIGGVII